jgi:beta-phosphoglucomutase-like phosphatase (HAD superfamily)
VRRAGLAALIFDVDGTLADTEEAHRQAFNAAFRAHRLEFRWSAGLYAELLGVPGGKERLRTYIERSTLAPDDRRFLLECVPAIHVTKTRLYGEIVDRGRLCVRPGISRLLGEARECGIRLAVASTTSPENVERLVAAALGPDALGWFAVIATGDAVARKKPAPDVYRLALRRLDVSPERAVAFEDSAIGVCAAKAASLFTVATPTAWTQGQDFAAADLILPSLGDPDAPFATEVARRVGALWLGVEQLATLHAATLSEESHAQAD